MLPHVRPVARRDPDRGDVLHHESSWDGQSVDPLLVLIQHLEGLDSRLLPQHRETLAERASNRNSSVEIGTVGLPQSWRSERERIVTMGQEGYMVCRFHRLE